MKKKYLAIAIAAFSIFTGTSKVQAQDTTLTLGKYLVETPWLVTVGVDFVDNDEKKNPFKIYNKGGKSKGHSPAFMTPARIAVEKDIYGFRHWKYTKGFSLQAVWTSTSIRPHYFASLDAYLKYDLNTLIGDTKFFDPYLVGGLGYSYLDYDGPTGPHSNRKANNPVQSLDNFLTINGGLGFNLWVFPNVALNFQSVAKFGKLLAVWEGTNYYQNSIGLVFKIGRTQEKAVPAPAPCTYKRSKEAEDALIHLREHINK